MQGMAMELQMGTQDIWLDGIWFSVVWSRDCSSCLDWLTAFTWHSGDRGTNPVMFNTQNPPEAQSSVQVYWKFFQLLSMPKLELSNRAGR